MVFEQTTIDTANRLAAVLSAKPWFSSVGITADETGDVAFVVYLKRKPRKGEPSVPSEWEGVPVRAQQFGTVRPASQHV